MRDARPATVNALHWLCVIAMLGGLVLAQPAGPVAAQLVETCAEPNDTPQLACRVPDDGTVRGVLHASDDVDVYAFLALDTGTLTIEHDDMYATQLPGSVGATPDLRALGASHRVEILDWNLESIGADDGKVWPTMIRATIPAPGTYFLVIRERARTLRRQPYRLRMSAEYQGGSAPTVVYTNDFRSDDNPADGADDGVYTVRANDAGGGVVAPFKDLPAARDFTLSFDTRIVEGNPEATYFAAVRQSRSGPFGNYNFSFNFREGLRLWRNDSSGATILAKNVGDGIFNRDGRVNRTVVRCAGARIEIFVNGAKLIDVADDLIMGDGVQLGAGTSGRPGQVEYDNILIAVP